MCAHSDSVVSDVAQDVLHASCDMVQHLHVCIISLYVYECETIWVYPRHHDQFISGNMSSPLPVIEA